MSWTNRAWAETAGAALRFSSARGFHIYPSPIGPYCLVLFTQNIQSHCLACSSFTFQQERIGVALFRSSICPWARWCRVMMSSDSFGRQLLCFETLTPKRESPKLGSRLTSDLEHLNFGAFSSCPLFLLCTYMNMDDAALLLHPLITRFRWQIIHMQAEKPHPEAVRAADSGWYHVASSCIMVLNSLKLQLSCCQLDICMAGGKKRNP